VQRQAPDTEAALRSIQRKRSPGGNPAQVRAAAGLIDQGLDVLHLARYGVRRRVAAVATTAAVPSLERTVAMGVPGAAQTGVTCRTSVRRKEFPEGSRNPESIP
jgi:hypothetical protein